jgi:polysaccharide biosynthesis protein PslH
VAPRSNLDRLRLTFSLRPYGVNLFANRALAAAVRSINPSDYDVIFTQCINSSQYAVLAPSSLPRVVLPQDAISTLYERRINTQSNPIKRFYLRWQQWRIHRYECRTYPLLDALILVSEADKAVLCKHCPEIPILVAPLGVEINPGTLPRPPATFVMSGAFYYPPNKDAALYLLQDIWQIIRARLPEAQLRLVGRSPAPEMLRYNGSEGITVVGEVPSVHAELASATIALNPMRFGSGVKIKIMEAFAAGTPVVSTTLGAEGLPVTAEENILLADDPGSFAEAAVRLANEKELQDKLRQNGIKAMQEGYSWENFARVSEEALMLAVKDHHKA